MVVEEIVGIIHLTMAASTLVWGVVQVRMAQILLDHERLRSSDWAAGVFLAVALWPLMMAGLVYDAILFHRELKELKEKNERQQRLQRDAHRGRGHAPKGPCACRSCR